MSSVVRLYSSKNGEISKFFNRFYNTSFSKTPSTIDLKWEQNYENPIEMVDIIGTFVENDDIYDISMWVNLDDNVFINVTKDNADELIKYIFERFPY